MPGLPTPWRPGSWCRCDGAETGKAGSARAFDAAWPTSLSTGKPAAAALGVASRSSGASGGFRRGWCCCEGQLHDGNAEPLPIDRVVARAKRTCTLAETEALPPISEGLSSFQWEHSLAHELIAGH